MTPIYRLKLSTPADGIPPRQTLRLYDLVTGDDREDCLRSEIIPVFTLPDEAAELLEEIQTVILAEDLLMVGLKPLLDGLDGKTCNPICTNCGDSLDMHRANDGDSPGCDLCDCQLYEGPACTCGKAEAYRTGFPDLHEIDKS